MIRQLNRNSLVKGSNLIRDGGWNCLLYSTSSKPPGTKDPSSSSTTAKSPGRPKSNPPTAAKEQPNATKAATGKGPLKEPTPPSKIGYQVPEYYEHEKFSYVDYDVTMERMRLPQPSSVSKK